MSDFYSESLGKIVTVSEVHPMPTTATLAGDVEIGSVEIKNAGTDDRAVVDPTGNLSVATGASATVPGLSTSRQTALTNTAVAVKASAGRLYKLRMDNDANAGVSTFVHVYDVAAGSVVVGTTVPKASYRVPGGSIRIEDYPVPLAFGTAIAVAVTTTLTGGAAPGVGIHVGIDYL